MRQRLGRSWFLAAAAACLLLAGIGAYGHYAVLDEGNFGDRAVSTLRSDEVRQEIAERIGARVVSEYPGLTADEPAVEYAVSTGVAGDLAFHAGFRSAAMRMHHALFADTGDEVSLRIAGSGAAVRAQLQRRLPEGAGRVPPIADPALLAIGSDGRERALRAVAPTARELTLPLTIIFGVAGLALLALALSRAPSRRRGVWEAGLTVAAVGGFVAAGVIAASDVVLTHFDTSFGDAVVTQIWNAYLGDLRTWGLAIGAAGLVVAAAAGGPRLSPRAVLATPAGRRGRLARATGLLVLAAVAVQVPVLLLHVGFVTLAAVFVYVAAGDLLRVLAPAGGTEPLPARVSAATLGKPAEP